MNRDYFLFLVALVAFGAMQTICDADLQPNPDTPFRQYRQRATDELNAARSDVDRLREHIEDLENTKSTYDKHAQVAITKIKESEAADQRSLQRAQERLAHFDKILKATVLYLPRSLQGDVKLQAEGSSPVPLVRQSVILESDCVTTGVDAQAVLIGEDGTRLTLGPATEATFRSADPAEIVWLLASGTLSVERDPAAVAGTVGRWRSGASGMSAVLPDVNGVSAMTLIVDAHHRIHAVLQTGQLDMTADQALPHGAWWDQALRSDEHRALMTGHWGRVRRVNGEVSLRRSDGSFRHVTSSDEFDPRETVELPADTKIWCELWERYQVAAQGPATLVRDHKDPLMLHLGSGSFYVRWDPFKSHVDMGQTIRVRTAHVQATDEKAEYEVQISADGRADWLLYHGALHLANTQS